jgi:hypothetical protein
MDMVMNNCLYCHKRIGIAKIFCSKECKENYFGLMNINIPKAFIKKCLFFCNEKQKEELLYQYALRHNYKLELVKIQFVQLSEKYYGIKI